MRMNDLHIYQQEGLLLERYIVYFWNHYGKYDKTNFRKITICNMNETNIQWLCDNIIKTFADIVRLFIMTGDEICLTQVSKPPLYDQIEALKEIQYADSRIYERVVSYIVEMINQ